MKSAPLDDSTSKLSNGTGKLKRAGELDDLIQSLRGLIIPFVQAADDAAQDRATGALSRDSAGSLRNVLVNSKRPDELAAELGVDVPDEGVGKDGLLRFIARLLALSVNTWDQGFLDKLYASNTPVGVISDLVLSVLNTNLHVYQVSPALSVIEKTMAHALATKFGFTGSFAGGISCQGGSSSNLTSLVVARNILHPDTKAVGNGNREFVIFTSAHGHYSVEKNAMICGFGDSNVWKVPVNEDGSMRAPELRKLVLRARDLNKTPLYVNATAGSTVRGSFDPFTEISSICKDFGLWLHIDASWGGPVIFSALHKWRLDGCHLADSLTVNPHKMMNVPTTCSFLLCPDVRKLHRANSTTAGYLFHETTDGDVWDLADLTLQCGRRGDSLKLALAWSYYGANGLERQIDHGFEMASYLHKLLLQSGNFVLVSDFPPPCFQVCFYYAPGQSFSEDATSNTKRTQRIVRSLMQRGFMVDYAPGEKGSFLRVVVNIQTLPTTMEGLVRAVQEVGKETA